jgi:AhpD family alkylhydroperoxidase
MENLIKKREKNVENFSIYRKKMPEAGRLYMDSVSEAYKEGVISSKYKRLMALVGALVHGCEPCMFSQTDRAIEQGATVEEILEACTVAISLGGTMAAGQTTRIVQFLREKNMITEEMEAGM